MTDQEHLFRIFGEIGKVIIEKARSDGLSEEDRMLLILGCEGMEKALSSAPDDPSLLLMTEEDCPRCGHRAVVPVTPTSGGPDTHVVILSSSGAKLFCAECSSFLARWDEDLEVWGRLDTAQVPDKHPWKKMIRMMLMNQQKMLVCIRDAFHSRDSLIALIGVLRENGTIKDEDLGGIEDLVSMQPLPERTYTELCQREELVEQALSDLERLEY